MTPQKNDKKCTLMFISSLAIVGTIGILRRYIPISSPFVLPSAVLLNQMSVLEGIFAVIILLIIDIVMMMIVAKVYEHIILHTGNRLKFSEMLNMAKANK